MQLLPILTCVLLASIVQAKLYSKFPKPKLRYVQNSQNWEFKPLLPEERRKLALFPKNPMKYVISLEPTIEISRPYLEKKKPVMKKLIFKDKKEIDANNEINQTKDEKILEVDVIQTPIVEVDVIKEISVEIIEDEPEESEFQNNARVEEDEPSEIVESEAPIDNSDNRNIMQLEDIILPPKTELEGSEENKSGEVANVQEINSSLGENEIDDAIENDNVSNVNDESQNNTSEEQTELKDIIEFEAPVDKSGNKNIVQLEDIILPPKAKLNEGVENKSNEVSPDVQKINNNSLGENEVDDAIENENVSKEESEFQNIANEEQIELSDIVESGGPVDNSDNENIVQLEDIILPPKTKLEGSVENKSNRISPDEQEINNSLGQNEVDDASEKDKITNENNESSNNGSEDQTELSDIVESEAPVDNSDNENIVQLEEIILPPKAKLDGNVENKSNEVSPDVQEINNNSGENEVVDASEKDKITNENNESQNNGSEDQTELSDIVESEAPVDNSDNENIVQLEEIILPPKAKLDGNVENKSNEVSPVVQEINNSSGENEVDDASEKDKITNENNESQNNGSEKQDELSDLIESEAPSDNGDNKNTIRLEDIILPPKAKLEGSVENKSNEVSPDINSSLGENEVNNASGKNNISNENDEFSEEQTQLSDIVESETPVDNSDNENIVQLEDIILPPKAKLEGSVENNSNEVSPDINSSLGENEVNDASEKYNISNENNESPNNASEKQDEISGIIESELPIENSDNENTVNLMDIILPPRTELEAIVENKSGEVLPDVEETDKSAGDNEVADINENEVSDKLNDKAIENVDNEVPDEMVTTETYFYEEPVIYRRKRGSNIIEEENMASTVAGFKFNARDRRLNNHLAYKNINT